MRSAHLLVPEFTLGASSVVSISSELSDSLSEPEELSELSEPDALPELSSSCFAFEAAFSVCFCLLSGSGEVERLELLSLSDEDEAAMAAVKS